MVTTTDLVSYWKLDEASGDAIDSHGSYDLTVSGATQGATGKINDCYNFDGSNDVIYTTSNPIANIGTGDFTYSTWVRIEDMTNQNNVVIVGNDNSGYDDAISMRMNSGEAYANLQDTGGTYITLTSSTSNFAEDTWHHIVIMRDGNTFALYVNNTLEDSDTGASAIDLDHADFNDNFGIGKRLGTLSWYLEGDVDECGLWERALTVTEIGELWNSGNGLAYPFSADDEDNAIFAFGGI